MTNDELADKISKLPAWAREHIKWLEKARNDANEEPKRLRQQLTSEKERYAKLQERCNAMEAILTCAARGGHETAQAYVDRIINEYKSEPEEDEPNSAPTVNDRDNF